MRHFQEVFIAREQLLLRPYGVAPEVKAILFDGKRAFQLLLLRIYISEFQRVEILVDDRVGELYGESVLLYRLRLRRKFIYADGVLVLEVLSCSTTCLFRQGSLYEQGIMLEAWLENPR